MAAILVVDDDPGICDLLAFDLTRAGHDVTVAADGAAAHAAMADSRPDLVVLDVMMPGQDGFEVLADIKTDLGRRDVPVVMLTARVDLADRARSGIEGAVRYVTKPFSPADLRAVIADVLDGEPEAVQRRRAAQEAVASLAASEAGRAPAAHRPRLTRYEPMRTVAPASRWPETEEKLTPRQRDLLAAVCRHADVASAAAELGLSRRSIYAALDRAAARAGHPSGPELVRAARAAHARS